MKMFDECDYVATKSHTVEIEGKSHRCVCIDIDKAKASGLDLEGFGIEQLTPAYTCLQADCKAKNHENIGEYDRFSTPYTTYTKTYPLTYMAAEYYAL